MKLVSFEFLPLCEWEEAPEYSRATLCAWGTITKLTNTKKWLFVGCLASTTCFTKSYWGTRSVNRLQGLGLVLRATWTKDSQLLLTIWEEEHFQFQYWKLPSRREVSFSSTFPRKIQAANYLLRLLGIIARALCCAPTDSIQFHTRYAYVNLEICMIRILTHFSHYQIRSPKDLFTSGWKPKNLKSRTYTKLPKEYLRFSLRFLMKRKEQHASNVRKGVAQREEKRIMFHENT